MQNEEEIIPVSEGKEFYLKVYRRWRLVACLDKVKVHLNGSFIGNLANGASLLVRLKDSSDVSLEIETQAWRNVFNLQISGDALFDFGFSWNGSGTLARYNNIKAFKVQGCRILNTELLTTKLQRTENWMSGIVIGLCMIVLFVIQLSQCHFRIH